MAYDGLLVVARDHERKFGIATCLRDLSEHGSRSISKPDSKFFARLVQWLLAESIRRFLSAVPAQYCRAGFHAHLAVRRRILGFPGEYPKSQPLFPQSSGPSP